MFYITNISDIPEAPFSVTLQSITAVSATLSWYAGHNRGSTQTFTVYYRKDGESNILFQGGIKDLEYGERFTYKISELEPDTKYYFKVQSRNIIGESTYLFEMSNTTLGKYFNFIGESILLVLQFGYKVIKHKDSLCIIIS